MSIKKRNFQSGIRLKPDDVALEGNEGEIKVGDTSKKIEAHLDGQDRAVVTEDQTQTLTNKDIDADNNTISNIETDNLKAGVLNTDLSGAATDTEIPSALAVKTALEGQNEASEVEYDPTLNPETSATNVQDALDDTGIASQAAQDAADAAQSTVDSHISSNSGVHGVVGNVVGDTDAQTLTNKVLDGASIENPTRLDVKKDTLANLETYALTASDGQVVFATDTQQMFQVIANELKSIGGGGATSFEVEQTSHGFSVGNGIYHNGTQWVLGQADDPDTLAYYAVVEVSDANTFIAADFGRIEVPSHGYTIGEYYFLSEATAGLATSTEPSTGFSNPLFYVEDANTLQIKVYRPNSIGNDITLDQLSDVNVSPANDKDVMVYNSTSGIWESSSELDAKQITNPTQLDVKKDTLSNLETYALTASDGQLVFSTDTKQMFQIIDSALSSVGSGSGGLDVFATERFEQTVAADLDSGNDATFLAGGSLVGTLANEEADPIKGDRSISYTQASGSINDYISLQAISISKKEQGNVASVSVYTTYDGNNNEIDLVVFDETNSDVLAEVPIRASSTALESVAIFDIPTTTTSLRVGFQVKLENDGAVLEFDEIEAKVNPFETTDIYASSEFETYTPTYQGITTSTDEFFWRQEGDSVRIKGYFVTSGSSASELQIGLPSGLTIDSVKVPSTTVVGQTAESNTGDDEFFILATGGDAFLNVGYRASGQALAFTPQTGSFLYGSGRTVSFDVLVPIAGWSNVRQGVTVKNTTSSDIASENRFEGEVAANGTEVKDNLGFFTVTKDGTGEYTVSYDNGRFTVPPIVTATASRSNNICNIKWKNVTATSASFNITNQDQINFDAPFSFTLTADEPDFVKERDRVYTFAADSLTGNYVRARGNAGQTLATTDGVPFTEVHDPANAWSTNTYTVQRNNSEITLVGSTNWTTSSNRYMALYVNNALIETFTYNASGNNFPFVFKLHRGSVSAGDTVHIQSINTAGTVVNDPSYHYLNISEEYGDRGTFVGKFGYETAYIKDVKPSGTAGGSAASGSFVTRDLNDLSGDTSFVSLSSNQFTLEAGVYDITIEAPAYICDRHLIKLRNVTDSVDYTGRGNFASVGNDVQNISTFEKRIVVSGSKTFEVQHRLTDAGSGGGSALGIAMGFGVDETYTQVKIVKKR